MVEQAERRRSQRVAARLPVKLYLDPDGSQSEGDAGVETTNISLSGVHFQSRRYMAPMTKLAMGLELEVPGSGGEAVEQALVQCQGLVVRVQPETAEAGSGPYEIAVFFTWIEPAGQAVLQDHINLQLSRQTEQ